MLKEHEDQSHTGDVYHSDFQCGRLAFFDLSVHSTTQLQPSYISSASTCAEVAAAAEELAKDLSHQDVVEETGCDFIPLVDPLVCGHILLCEYSKHAIADRTTARSGASVKLARKHLYLLLQISVFLWTNS